MATLILKRSSEWNNKMRKIEIFLDDEIIGEIGNGETKELEIPAGNHTVHTKIDWCGSRKLEFVVSENTPAKFYVSGFKFGNWLLPVFAVILLGYFGLNMIHAIDIRFLALLLAPGFLYLVYHLSLGRNQYLQLQEIR
jgi:hypothetical protein